VTKGEDVAAGGGGGLVAANGAVRDVRPGQHLASFREQSASFEEHLASCRDHSALFWEHSASFRRIFGIVV
jgi:hypothetical protein